MSVSGGLTFAGDGKLYFVASRWRDPKYAFLFIWFFISLAPGMLSQPAPNSTRTLAVQTVLFTLMGMAVQEVMRITGTTDVAIQLGRPEAISGNGQPSVQS